MPITSEHWKKIKPLTLLKEPLTQALLDLEAVRALLEAKASRQHLAKFSAALKLVHDAIRQTAEQCNALLHRDCLKQLPLLSAQVRDLYKRTQEDQKDFALQLKNYERLRNRTANVMEIICHQPDAGKIDR